MHEPAERADIVPVAPFAGLDARRQRRFRIAGVRHLDRRGAVVRLIVSVARDAEERIFVGRVFIFCVAF